MGRIEKEMIELKRNDSNGNQTETSDHSSAQPSAVIDLKSDDDAKEEEEDNEEEEDDNDDDDVFCSHAALYSAAASKSPIRSCDEEALWKILCDNEIDVYRREKGYDFKNRKQLIKLQKHILPWWEQRHMKFPTLWRLAIKYLAISASASPSERAFSTAGNIVTNKRCRLSTMTVSDCHFLHENQ